MSMADFEPASGFNLPPGCSEGGPRAPWNAPEPRCCGLCTQWCSGGGGQGMCGKQFDAILDSLPYPERVKVSDVACCIEDEESDRAIDCPWYEERK